MRLGFLPAFFSLVPVVLDHADMAYAPPDGGGGLGAAAAAAAAEGLFDADSVRDHEELLGQLESFLKVEERLALKKNFSDVLGRSLARKERGQVTLVVHCKHPKNFFNWIRKAQQDRCGKACPC